MENEKKREESDDMEIITILIIIILILIVVVIVLALKNAKQYKKFPLTKRVCATCASWKGGDFNSSGKIVSVRANEQHFCDEHNHHTYETTSCDKRMKKLYSFR